MSGSTAIKVILVLTVAASATAGHAAEFALSGYQKWENGISADPHFFPVAVWLQQPKNAERFREAGINLYVGLWRGPTEVQLRALKAAGMSVICAQNRVGLTSENADVPITAMCKRHDRALYVFAVNMRDRAATATIELSQPTASANVQVLGKNRTMEIRDRQFEDTFDGYAVHLYRLEEVNGP